MSLPRSLAFITTVHDPERRLLLRLRRYADLLSTYRAAYAFVTEQTDELVIDALNRAGVDVVIGPSGAAGTGQREVLGRAIRAAHSDLFLCDFDRWLHWADRFPAELAGLPGIVAQDHPDAWYICLGRTPPAFASHPIAQRHPEAITNLALSTLVGRPLDATAGASWIRSAAAGLILARSVATTKATDLEWPGLVLAADPARLAGVQMEGLEFETGAYYAREVSSAGSLSAWIRETYDRPQVLQQRLQLAADSIAALLRVTDHDRA